MHIVKDMERPPKDGHIRVKMLKHVGQFSPNDIVDCDEHTAKTLCEVSHVNDGTRLVPHTKAMTLDQFKKADQASKEIDVLTVGEMHEMGIKNVVKTPDDPMFEKNLQIAKQAAEEEQQTQQEIVNVKNKKKKKAMN